MLVRNGTGATDGIVSFAPDFQYFIRPNAQTNLHDAALLGFKSHIELF